jgi:ring-1,2-phenylacetyl-CoA epoxidase subunit PaaE
MALSYTFKKVIGVKQETLKSKSITIATENDSDFKYHSGQYITLRIKINGEQLVRSYSISSCPFSDKNITFTVKEIENGRVSSYLNKQINVGDELEILPPIGNFKIENSNINQYQNYFFLAAGSGITPIISMTKTLLLNNSKSDIQLIYGNKSKSEIIFLDELNELQNQNSNFNVYHLLTKENNSIAFSSERISINVIEKISLEKNIRINENCGFYICGPDEMMRNMNYHLIERKVDKSNIYFESFTTSNPTEKKITTENKNSEYPKTITVVIGGKEHLIKINEGETILDAAMDLDPPFSCMSASCMVCKAKVLEGKVIMDDEGPLDEKEMSKGYILTCQSHPDGENIKISYDI